MSAATVPWLSLLVPVYNVAEWLPACLKAIAQQDLTGVELLFLDDCATDTSPALLQAWLQRHSSLNARLLRHERNQGLSAARNHLLEAAQGEYVWFLDSDDVLLAGAVASLRQTLDRHPVDLVACDFAYLRDQPRFKHRLRGERHVRTFAGRSSQASSDTAALLAGLLVLGYLHSWSKVSRRSLWGDDLRFPVGHTFEDMATTPDLAARAHSHIHVPQVWVAYRQRAGSILSTASLNKTDDMMRALQALPKRLQPFSESDSSVRFAASHFAARSFIGAVRFASRKGDAIRMQQYREAFLAALCMPADELMAQYLRRGWWWRTLRLRHWLARAAPSAAV